MTFADGIKPKVKKPVYLHPDRVRSHPEVTLDFVAPLRLSMKDGLGKLTRPLNLSVYGNRSLECHCGNRTGLVPT